VATTFLAAQSEDEGRKCSPCPPVPRANAHENFKSIKLHGDGGPDPQGALPPTGRSKEAFALLPRWHECQGTGNTPKPVDELRRKRLRLEDDPNDRAFILYKHGPGVHQQWGSPEGFWISTTKVLDPAIANCPRLNQMAVILTDLWAPWLRRGQTNR